MSAVPPELPEVSGRSRAPFKKGSAALVTRGAAAHLLAAALAAHRVQVAAPGGSFAQRPPTARSKCRVLWKRPGCVTFSDLCFSVVIKIAQVGGFVNRLFVEKRLNSGKKNGIIYDVVVWSLRFASSEAVPRGRVQY